MSRSIDRYGVPVLLIYSALSTGLVSADEKTGYYGLGRTATQTQIAGWDIDVRPDGLGLPPGQGSVEEGDELYQEKCAQCHGVFGEGTGRWPVLAGGEDSLSDERPEKTVGSYWPYATTLWDYIHRAMPFFNPQSLNNNEVYALTAFILNLNEIVDDDFVASQENLAKITMPNSHGFIDDPRPDVVSLPCMKDCKDPASIKITWDASDLGVTPVDHLQVTASAAGAAIETPEANPADPGQTIYQRACAACHDNGLAGAPKTGDKNAWVTRIGQGIDVLVDHAINGFRGEAGYMPAKGGNATLSDDEVTAAVEYMVQRSQDKELQL